VASLRQRLGPQDQALDLSTLPADVVKAMHAALDAAESVVPPAVKKRTCKSASKEASLPTNKKWQKLLADFTDAHKTVLPRSDLAKQVNIAVNQCFGGPLERGIAAADNPLGEPGEKRQAKLHRQGVLDAVNTDAQESVAAFHTAVRWVCKECKVHPAYALSRLTYRRANLRSKSPMFKQAVETFTRLERKHKRKKAELQEQAVKGAGTYAKLRAKWATSIGLRLAELNQAQEEEEEEDELSLLVSIVISLLFLSFSLLLLPYS
jgi:hypothetical protein